MKNLRNKLTFIVIIVAAIFMLGRADQIKKEF
jgi:hypothetical protein